MATAISKMPPHDRETAELILSDREGSEPKLVARALTEMVQQLNPNAKRVSPWTVKYHRRGDCRCGLDEEDS